MNALLRWTIDIQIARPCQLCCASPRSFRSRIGSLSHVSSLDSSNNTLPEASSSSIKRRRDKEWEKVIVLTGPTAVGKTAISLLVAERLNGEVVSADSVQVYRGLNIGSAKILPEEQRGIQHHLLDILDPHEDFSAGQFYELSRAAIAAILQRGKVPIVVGGTGFYLRWCIHGKPQTPVTTPEVARKVQELLRKVKLGLEKGNGAVSESELWEAYCQAVEDLGDGESAHRLRMEPNNQYRLERVLTIILSTGKPLAEMNHDRLAEPDYDFRCFFLTRPRVELYDRIGHRCELMVRDGLLKEAEWLLDQGLTSNTNSATKSIGYRQAMEFVERCRQSDCPPSTKDLMEMVSHLQAKSRKYCHQQLSWFRDEKMFKWLDATRPPSDVADEICQLFEENEHQGSDGQSGALSKEEQNQMRRYIYQNHFLDSPSLQEGILKQLQCSAQPAGLQ